MRISDWSSDVCSSDLAGARQNAGQQAHRQAAGDVHAERPPGIARAKQRQRPAPAQIAQASADAAAGHHQQEADWLKRCHSPPLEEDMRAVEAECPDYSPRDLRPQLLRLTA